MPILTHRRHRLRYPYSRVQAAGRCCGQRLHALLRVHGKRMVGCQARGRVHRGHGLYGQLDTLAEAAATVTVLKPTMPVALVHLMRR